MEPSLLPEGGVRLSSQACPTQRHQCPPHQQGPWQVCLQAQDWQSSMVLGRNGAGIRVVRFPPCSTMYDTGLPRTICINTAYAMDSLSPFLTSLPTGLPSTTPASPCDAALASSLWLQCGLGPTLWSLWDSLYGSGPPRGAPL